MDTYTWIRGELDITVTDDRRMIAITKCLKGMNTPKRPQSMTDTLAGISDAERYVHEVYPKLLERVPGRYDYYGYMGGAVAFIVKTANLRLLPDERHMSKLAQKYGPMDELMMLTMARTTHGESIWNCLEPSGGMAREITLEAEQYGEGSELGVYGPGKGWVRFVLPSHIADCQADLDCEQTRWWHIIRPGFPCAFEAQVRPLDHGQDELDGRKGVLQPGHIGEFNLTSAAMLNLPGYDWCVCDTEARPGRDDEPEWVGLDRVIWGITPQALAIRPIVAYQFSRSGGLEYSGLHLPLVYDIIPHVISPNTTLPMLKALGWL